MDQESGHYFFDTYLKYFPHTQDTSLEFINLLHQSHTTTSTLAEKVHQNQAFLHFLLRVGHELQSKSKWASQEDTESDEPHEKTHLQTEKMVSWLGKQGTRNLLIHFRLKSLFEEGLPKSEQDQFDFDFKKTIEKALQTESYAEDHRFAYSDRAFLGGLIWDWFLALAESQNQLQQENLSTYWKQALNDAHFAYELAQSTNHLPFDEYMFPGILVLHLARLAQIILYENHENWKTYQSRLESLKTPISPTFQAVLERQHFGTSRFELAGLMTHFFKPLLPIEAALYYTFFPKQLKTSFPKQESLSALFFSTELLRQSRGKKEEKINLLWELEKEHFEKLGLRPKHFQNVISKFEKKG